MAKGPSRLDLRFLVGAFAVVAVTFFTANVVTQRAMHEIDVASDEIAFDSAPSIEHLAAVRTAVRHTEFLVGDELTRRDGTSGSAVEQALAQVNQEANAYLGLPTFPGETNFWGDLSSSIATFNGAVERVLAQSEVDAAEPSRAALSRVMLAANGVSDAATRAIEFNAKHGRELALRIKSVRRNAGWIGYALNASCVLFAVLAAVMVRSQLRRYGVLVETHAALQETRATELEAFAARAAHDILNPVSATQMALALAARRDIEDGRLRELVDRALNNQRRIRNIIDGLFEFARAGARPATGAVADVQAVVDDVAACVRPAAERRKIDVRVEDLPSCRAACSVGVLTSVVSNLAHNAMKYMGDRAVRRVTVRAVERGSFVRVEVEDTGPGIPDDAVDEIFLPYVRGPTYGKEGLGLGLATVKRLCEAHGGRVGVRSALDQGSIFWIELPLASASPGAPGQGITVAGGGAP
ncbi:MAG TPA: HAMP domain-containing sensor histidine kinase [Anaeromyxobacteraceae bacterium]|nr:HAMP domain-containing sensor histidine kinase [Anaeromyxobacteraceae bacterium]